MNYLSSLTSEQLVGKRVLVRLDLNVPISEGGTIAESDRDRITKSLPTIEFLKQAGAKIIIISHIGRDPHESLKPVADVMEIPLFESFKPELLDEHMTIMLENLRQNPGEESNDEVFAKNLASYADLYINDAFAVSHRNHASIVAIPKFLPSFMGFQFESEVKHLSASFNAPHPSILVLGGAKFETKLPVIMKFIPIVDHIIIGGALANNFYKEQGYETGASLIDPDADLQAILGNKKIIVPDRVIVESEQGQAEKHIAEVIPGEKIVDIAPAGIEDHTSLFKDAQFVLWNGPMGNYENGFTAGSEKIANMIAESGAQSIVGGGDSVALIEQLGLAEKFGFLSTGGGAMLEYLSEGTLVGIDALGGAREL